LKNSKSISNKKKLTARQERFVAEYLVDLNAKQAAIRAGYSKKTAEQQSYELLRLPWVSAAILAGQRSQLGNAELSAVRVLEELRRIAFLDPRGFFDAAGNLKPIGELTAEQSAALASLEVIKKNAEAGDGKIDTVHKIRFWAKPDALEMLAKRFALLVERREETHTIITLEQRLTAGRERLAKK